MGHGNGIALLDGFLLTGILPYKVSANPYSCNFYAVFVVNFE